MKKALFITVSGLALLATANVPAAQTNLVQSLRFNLSALFQGANVTNQNLVTYSTVPRKISNLDVIQALGASLGRTFPMSAKLVVVTELPDHDPKVMVQDGTNRVSVASYFSLDPDDVRVSKGVTALDTEIERGTEYSIWSFRLKDDENHPDLNLHFRVRGLTQAKFRTLLNSQGVIIGEAEELIGTVAGTVDINDQEGVVRGTVSTTGRVIEIVD